MHQFFQKAVYSIVAIEAARQDVPLTCWGVSMRLYGVKSWKT